MPTTYSRGDVWLAEIGQQVGCEQSGYRPVVIIQNDIGNHFSSTVIVAMISSSMKKKRIPTHVSVNQAESGKMYNSLILLEQIRTIDKTRLTRKVARLTKETMAEINDTLMVSLAIPQKEKATAENGRESNLPQSLYH